MNHYQQLQNKDFVKVIIFLTSSTGDGEFPDNGIKFQSYLKKESSNTALSHIFYTVLGLGDSNYSKFQGAPRFLDQRLAELGAKKFYYRGEADDATNLALVVEPWLEGLPKALKQEIERLKSLSVSEFKALLETQTHILNQDNISKSLEEDQSTINYGATIIERQLICDDVDKQVYQVKLKLSRNITRERLDVGQSIQVFARNSSSDVTKIIQAFGWNKDQLIGNYTIEELLSTKIDITKRKLNMDALVKHFQMFTSDFQDDLDRLLGEEKTKFTLLELVELSEPFATGRFMLSEACLEEGLLKLQPRYYSILDDPYIDSDGNQKEQSNILSLGFTLHKYKNDFSTEKLGLCTSYLAQTTLNTQIECLISKNTKILQLPQQLNDGLKLLIIAMGTGVVPFIGMLQRIKALGKQIQIQMFYGVRNNQTSFYFGEFLTNYFQNLSPNSHLYVACSRELKEDFRNQNVTFTQGRLQQVLNRFCLRKFDLVQAGEQTSPKADINTQILICGNKNALQKSVFESLGISEDQKRQMQESGNLLMELWNE